MGTLEEFALWLVGIVNTVGCPGIFLAMMFGNMLVPIPVEVILIPAGYLAEQDQMRLWLLLICAVAGDIAGSLISYYVAFHFGRRIITKYGKYFFFGPERMEMLDRFFVSHGEISTLTGRLVPGLRHFMAFPAGLSHMNVKKFILYTGAGGGLWSGILVGVGYLIGGNKDMIKHYMPFLQGIVITGVVLMIVLYLRRHRKQKLEGTDGHA